MTTKGVRSLEQLYRFGSTSRVLNLLRTFENNSNNSEYEMYPLFENPRLNKAMIIKHNIRSDEVYLMSRRQKVATKIILPMVANELSFGGQSIFVSQKNYKKVLSEALGVEQETLARDFEILTLINKLPSFDPFLLKEYLKRHNYFPAECYFDLSPKDVENMSAFAAEEVSRLIGIAFASDDGAKSTELVNKMVALILSNEADEKLDPFRIALGLEGEAFREGVFAWRGFLYFKWQMSTIQSSLSRVSNSISKVTLINRASAETRANINNSIIQLKTSIQNVITKCNTTMALYDRAFNDLVEKAHAAAFRKFLLDSPKLFIELGYMMGNVSHISSFWNFRFPPSKPLSMDIVEFDELLNDFVGSLNNESSRTLGLALQATS